MLLQKDHFSVTSLFKSVKANSLWKEKQVFLDVLLQPRSLPVRLPGFIPYFVQAPNPSLLSSLSLPQR